ncbi:MAG: HDOD domain-containing protein, partial [Gammaproteobacteria bacterium]
MSGTDPLSWLSSIEHMPSLPCEARHLISALQDDGIGTNELVKTIEAHPGISARLLALANSACPPPDVPISTLDNACSRLGFLVVRSVSIGLAVMAPFNVLQCPAFDFHRYWMDSMLVAEGAALLADACKKTDLSMQGLEPTARSAGILHNLGLLCLAHYKPVETQRVFIESVKNPETRLTESLRRTFATDYAEIGYRLLSIWGIPESLTTAIRYHLDFGYRGRYWELSELIGYAAIIVRALHEPGKSLTEHLPPSSG